jgi:hypothetical protein
MRQTDWIYASGFMRQDLCVTGFMRQGFMRQGLMRQTGMVLLETVS